jgi:hypothetical protein
MKKICLLILFLLSNFIFSQKREDDFRNELKNLTNVDQLKKENIDFIAYKEFSVGSYRISKANDPNRCPKCDYNYSTYVFWKKNDINYLQRFDNCGKYFPLKIDNENVLNFDNENFEKIKSEKIKPFQNKNKNIVMIDHSTFKEFLISKNGKETYNYFDMYNLETDSKNPNINYIFNRNLKLVKLNYMIENEIKNLENLNLFKRDLSKCVGN